MFKHKLLIVLLVIFIIICVNQLIITSEEFQNRCTQPSSNDVSTENFNVNPKDPKCVGSCIHRFTGTEISTGIPNQRGNIIGLEADIISSKCGDCLRNFYKPLELIREVPDPQDI